LSKKYAKANKTLRRRSKSQLLMVYYIQKAQIWRKIYVSDQSSSIFDLSKLKSKKSISIINKLARIWRKYLYLLCKS